MDKLIDQIVENYFLGGNLNEMLREIEMIRKRNSRIRENKRWSRYLYYGTFRNW